MAHRRATSHSEQIAELTAVDVATRFAAARPGTFDATLRSTTAHLIDLLGARGAIVHLGGRGPMIVTAPGAPDAAALLTAAGRNVVPGISTDGDIAAAEASAGEQEAVVLFARSGTPWADTQLRLVQFLADLTCATAARLDAEHDDAAELARYKAIVQNAADIVLVMDADGVLQYISPAAERLLGLDIPSLVGTNVLDIIHPEDAASAVEGLGQLVERPGPGDPEPTEVRIRNAAGEYRFLSAYGNNQLHNPLVRGLVVTARDETERHRAQEALQVSEARLRAILNSSPDMITVLDSYANVVLSNQASRRILGYPETRVTSELFDFIHPDDTEHVRERITDLFARPGPAGEPILMRIADVHGNYHYLENNADNLLHDPLVNGIVITARDVTDRMAALEALRASSAQLSGALQSLQDAAMLTDASGLNILYANPAFADLCGVAAHEVLDVPMMQAGFAARVVDSDAWRARSVEEVANRVPTRGFEVQTVDGRTWERDYVPVQDDEGVYGHLWVFRDVTPHKQAEQSLVEALDAAVNASRVKSRFVAAVGHEIRTPMHAILGMLELLGETDLNDDQRSLLTTVIASATVLRAMLDDLLDFSKIDAGRMNLKPEPFDVVRTIEESVIALGPAATKRGLSLEFDPDRTLPPVLIGDSRRLRQIVGNLVDNAIKYTEEGCVTVRVEATGTHSGRSFPVRISVQDTGVGIPLDVIDTLFNPFVQVDDARRPDRHGTGLGLAISRRLAELMSGSLTVESVEGAGSTFVLTVTLDVPESSIESPATAEAPRPQRRAARILVVEDDEVNQLLARRQLDRLGHDAVIAGTGEDALALVEREQFEIILVDRQLPGIDGLETTRRIRAAERDGHRAFIIAMTASAFPEDERACLAAGMDGYLAKPVSLATLAEAIDDALQQATPPTHAPRPSPVRAALARLVDELEDRQAVERLASAYLEQLSDRCRAIAYARDTETLGYAAHALRGRSALLGLDAVAEWCRIAEVQARNNPAQPIRAEIGELVELCRDAREELTAWLEGGSGGPSA